VRRVGTAELARRRHGSEAGFALLGRVIGAS
jgi:hypothetical protein